MNVEYISWVSEADVLIIFLSRNFFFSSRSLKTFSLGRKRHLCKTFFKRLWSLFFCIEFVV